VLPKKREAAAQAEGDADIAAVQYTGKRQARGDGEERESAASWT
jgi:hypothetical protein